MHNLILDRKWRGHIDEDGLNNLRPCTNAQNQQNSWARSGKFRFARLNCV